VAVQNAGTEVVDAKAGAGSATLSMAYAAYLFVASCLKAMKGDTGIVECCYVEDSTVEGCDFFAQRVTLGKQGIVSRWASFWSFSYSHIHMFHGFGPNCLPVTLQ
jgi:malate dehydrogenase